MLWRIIEILKYLFIISEDHFLLDLNLDLDQNFVNNFSDL